MESIQSIQSRVDQKIQDKQIDMVYKLVQAIFADDALVIVDAVSYEGAETLDVEAAGIIFRLITDWGSPVDVREFVRSYLYDGSYSEGIKEVQAKNDLEDSYDNQF